MLTPVLIAHLQVLAARIRSTAACSAPGQTDPVDNAMAVGELGDNAMAVGEGCIPDRDGDFTCYANHCLGT